MPGVTISNAPGRPKNVYGQLLLPWPDPIELVEGTTVDVSLRADLIGEEYVWTWETHCNEHHFLPNRSHAARRIIGLRSMMKGRLSNSPWNACRVASL